MTEQELAELAELAAHGRGRRDEATGFYEWYDVDLSPVVCVVLSDPDNFDVSPWVRAISDA